MSDVRVICGDNNGGPHAEVTYGGVNEEKVTDDWISRARVPVEAMFRDTFGSDPESVIVVVTAESTGEERSDA